MNNVPDLNTQHTTETDSINLSKIFRKLIDKWYWFIISASLCLVVAFFYGKYKAPLYQIYASVLVNDDNKGGGLGKQAGAMMDLGGLMGTKSSVDNETHILKTRFLMEQVVRELQLNIIYSKKIGIGTREIYQSPFRVNITKSVDTIITTKLTINKIPNNKLRVSAIGFEKDLNWNESFTIKNLGTLQLIQNPGTAMNDGDYFTTISSIDERTTALINDMVIGATNKQESIIDLGLTYPLPKKGEDILNALINKYTQSNLIDKNNIADSTYKFITERLSILSGELGDVENKVSDFKRDNRLADMSEQSKLLVQNTGEFTTELAKAETQVSILNDLEIYLKDNTKNKRVFPTSLLPSDMVFSSMMEQYNLLLIEREKQLLSVTETSPFIQNIDSQIAGLRAGILANITSTKNTFVLTRNKLRSQLNAAEGQIGGVPQIEKNYLKLARNQQIKQELYIFLMQKAEETAISKTSNTSIAKVIDPPKASFYPISPQKTIIYLVALVIGLIIPLVLILGGDLISTTIKTKDDIIAATNVPVIGEISHNKGTDNMIVANQGRSAISEQFRALRTNLSFYLKEKDQKVILLTSSMSGEGKSFTAINLGNILALTGKKVLLMELDLRKPGLSSKLDIPNTIGFSNFTIDSTILVDDLIKPLAINANLFIMSSGPLPPNPAETLMSDRIESLFDKLKAQFDYIIMDAPPIGVVTDAQLLSKYADMTIYLVRQKVTTKEQLKIVHDLYRSQKIKNLGIVVNDIVSKTYGYGYGYGNYGEIKEKTGIEKVLGMFKKA